MKYSQIITSLLDNDFYKFTMGQLFLHQMTDMNVEWTYKNRDAAERKFTKEMVQEIDEQIKAYCDLRFKKDELEYLASIPWIKKDYIDFLSLYKPLYRHFSVKYDEANKQLDLKICGPQFINTYYETPVMSIISEVWFRMSHTEAEYEKLEQTLIKNTKFKINALNCGKYRIGAFSEFGTRRRFSKQKHGEIIELFAKTLKTPYSTFVGTSNVYYAMKFGIKAIGTMAHEAIMTIGQGYPERNPAYSNKFTMEAWHKEYGTENGTYLTDAITTNCFLKDFTKAEAKLFDGVRHDSGDPFEWGNKMIDVYAKYNINPITKTLLFSDSLDFERADALYSFFKDQIKVAFGIGTYIANDCGEKAMNQVLKVTEANGIPVCKLSDSENDKVTGLPGKFMGKSKEYLEYLKRTINWHMNH